MGAALIQIPFQGGINESVDARHLASPELISATNVVFTKDGSLEKRYGYTDLSSDVGAVKRLAVFRDELLYVDGTNLYTRNSTGAAWAARDRVAEPKVTRKPLFNASESVQPTDIAYGNGYAISVWVENSSAYALIVERSTGAVVLGPTAVGTAGVSVTVRVCVVGTTAIAVTMTSTPTIVASTISLASAPAAWGAITTISDGGGSVPISITGVFALAAMTSTFALSYEMAGTNLRTRTFNTALAVQASATTAMPAGTFVNMSATGTTGETLWIAAGSCPAVNTDVYAIGLNPATLATTVAATLLIAVTGISARLATERVSSTVVAVVSSNVTNILQWRQFNTSAAAVGVTRVTNNQRLVAGPKMVGGRCMAVTLFRDDAQGTFYVVDLMTDDTSTANLRARLLSVVAPRVANVASATLDVAKPVCQFSAVDSSTFLTSVTVTRNARGRIGVELVTIDGGSGRRFMRSQCGDLLYLGGQTYDGRFVVENGFAWYPRHETVATDAGAGSIEAGTYAYRMSYVWIDNQGNIHRSRPSDASSVTIGASRNVTLTPTSLNLTCRQEATSSPSPSVYVEVYRAKTDGDAIYYKITTEPFPAANANAITAASFTITDSTTMAAIAASPLLYPPAWFEGGILEPWCPPSFTHVVSHKNRAWGIGDDEAMVWFSTAYEPGEAPWFHVNQTFTVRDTTEPLVALGTLDDKLVVFTRSRIYYLVGDGPPLNGFGADLSEPQRVASPVGCIDPRSVVAGPAGLYFQAESGIWLLTRSLEVLFIGDAVSASTASYPVCASAVLVPSQHHVRFAMRASDTAGADGLLLVLDYRRGRWTSFSLTKGGGVGNEDLAALACGVYHPTLGYVVAHDQSSEAYVRREDTTSWLDQGAYFVQAEAILAWLKAGGLQGDQEVVGVWLLGQRYSAHGISVEFAHDYNASYETAQVRSEAEVTAEGEVFQGRFIPARQQGEALLVRLRDSAPAVLGTGRGGAWNGLAFETNVKGGGHKNLAAAAKS